MKNLTLKCDFVRKAEETYSHPVSAIAEEPGCYCVGGALYLALTKPKDAKRTRRENRFPPYYYLTRTLQTINPNLSTHDAKEAAQAIINFNDAGLMANAWMVADEACSKGK